MVKILLVLAILFLFSCSDDDSAKCTDRGPLCSKHEENYFSCKSYEYYNTGPYSHTEYVYVNIYYKVKDNEGEWTYWSNYPEMYNHYCR